MISNWTDIILNCYSPVEVWKDIFTLLQKIALEFNSPDKLHEQTVAPDLLLAETAWELWSLYPDNATRTSKLLKEWCSTSSIIGCAVLVLDALSLREMPLIIRGAEERNIQILSLKITGSELPSDTDQFAQALGVTSRSTIKNNCAPSSFKLFTEKYYTDVISLPFEDSIGIIPNEPNIFIWHTWLDDMIHQPKNEPDQIYKAALKIIQEDGFWKFVNRLRQGRKLTITSDHGYAVSKLFSSKESDPFVKEKLRETFGASRCKKASLEWQERFMPPIVINCNGHHVVIGQRKWDVQGGFPDMCHGGASLLEVAVPFIELPPL